MLPAGVLINRMINAMGDSETPELEPGQVWRDDVGLLFRIVRLDDQWVYTVHPKTSKKYSGPDARAVNQLPRSWFSRPGWDLVEVAPPYYAELVARLERSGGKADEC